VIPNYLRKANALFYEFEEIGLNKTLGYDYAGRTWFTNIRQFYWNKRRSANSDGGYAYLNVTSARALLDSKTSIVMFFRGRA